MKDQPDNPLLRDLHRVLKYEIQFSGTFALSMVIPGCPNPGLDVDGVGRVPLPLTEQTAKQILSIGDQAPCGRGTETIMDITVRDTIQINASNIRFMNPKWAPAIQEWVEKEVWSGLGCAPFASPPKCELYKLLLYKPGAHFLPHQDTEKAPGMFATLVVVLPSEFTGGEIHVSHGGESKILDNAKDSAFETTVLAWYTDVTHEVKEITSGYRLALSYHLINTSPGINPPRLPSSDSSLQSVREIFSKWSRNEYPALRVNQAVAYGFVHEYSDASLREVIMKGKDHHITSILKHAGDLEGVLVLMGWLNAYVEGCTSDHGWQIYAGDGDFPEFGWDSGTETTPVMSHVFETKMWLESVRDLQGRKAGISKIKVDKDSILPYRAFSGVIPDDSKLYKGYWGNEGATVEFAYKCAALVMFPKEKQLSLMLSLDGAEKWALEELEESKPEGPSRENCEIIDFLAQKGGGDTMATILETAIGWKDATVWGRIVGQNPGFFLGQKGYTDLCDGWKEFKFDGVRPTFEKLFQERGKLQKASIGFLLFIKEKLPFGADPQKDEWISAQVTLAMETFAPEKDYELHPGVIEIVRWKGLEFTSSVILPRFPENEYVSHDHRVDLGLELIKHREELIALPQAEDQTSNAELFGHILDKILAAKIPRVFRWDSYRWPRVVSSLFSICIPGNRTKHYEDLLNLVSRPPTKSFYILYVEFYAKIVPDLVKQLCEGGIKVSSSPSCQFFCHIIGMYLQEILGSKEGSPYLKFSMLTCGHEACSRVNDFLRSEETKMSIPLDDETKRCVTDISIDKRYSLFDSDTCWSRKPPTVDLVKKHEAMAAQHWSVRLADAREFLKSIGTDEEISQIMGERYQDVGQALEGSRAFVITKTEREADEAMVGIE